MPSHDPSDTHLTEAKKTTQLPRFALARALVCLCLVGLLASTLQPLTQSRNYAVFWIITCVMTCVSYLGLSSVITFLAVCFVLPKRLRGRPEPGAGRKTFLWIVQIGLGLLASHAVAVSLVIDGLSPLRAELLGKVITAVTLPLPPLLCGVHIQEWWAVVLYPIQKIFNPFSRVIDRLLWGVPSQTPGDGVP